MQKQEIIDKYIAYAQEHGKLPLFFTFAGKIGIEYSELRQNFKDKDALFAEIFGQIYERTLIALHSDETYPEYRAYEKMLAFHFTFLNIAQSSRAAIAAEVRSHRIFWFDIPSLDTLKPALMSFISQIVQEAQANGEIPNRMIQSNLNKIVWYQFLYLLRFWSADESPNQENTDAAVEKSTALVFEILGRNLVDVGFDFGKFFFQNLK